MKRLFLFLSLSQLFFIVSCSKPGGDPPPPPPPPVDTTVHVTEVKVDPANFILQPSLTLHISATVLPANAADKKIIWISSNTSVATVDAFGLVKALTVGSADITASSDENGAIKAIAKLTVLNTYNVNVVGRGYTTSWDNCAICWRNGVKSGLPGGVTVGANATAITYSGTDEYIAGTTVNQNNWPIPTYWKNGAAHIVGNPAAEYLNFPQSIAIDGTKVYVAGSSFYNSECPVYCFGRSRAWYFLDNGTTVSQVPLYDSISSTVAYGIALKGTDVYIAGAQANDNGPRWATLWKNNVSNAQALSATTGFYNANALAWLGNDLYIAAAGGCGDYGCNATSFLIKNDISNRINLTDGTKDSKIFCIAFSGNTIYVGGYEKNDAGKSVAKYWKIDGNTVSVRTLSDGTKITNVNGIAVSGNDVFIVGNELSDSGERKAKCWRAYEGLPTAPSLDISDYYVPYGYEANGIYIK